jgi:hypothetical protein
LSASAVMLECLPGLRSKTVASIDKLTTNASLKKALKAAAVTREMKQAQHDVMTAMYLRPADRCLREVRLYRAA